MRLGVKTQQDTLEDHIRLDPSTARYAGIVGIVGGIGLAISLALAMTDGEAFLRGYLVNFAFFTSLALGALFFVIIQHLTRAGWSVVVRRLAEHVTSAFPWLALLSLPILIPMLLGFEAAHHVYPWTDADLVAHDEILTGKAAYLNVPFFLLRVVIYFVVWCLLGHFFFTNSVRQDESGDPALTNKMQALSAPGVILYALTTTFFAFDLLMSLDPHWFSTIFGVYYFSGAAVGFFSLLALLMVSLNRAGYLTKTISVDHYHDVGKLIFAFVVFWAYIAFSQYLLIWYANIPEETIWFVTRQQGPWFNLSMILLFGHFVIPFLGLISRHPKRRSTVLAVGAAWVLLMHWFDMLYLVLPRIEHGTEQVVGLRLTEMMQCVTCLVGIGGVCTWAVLRRMGQTALAPRRDPRLGESLEFENI